MTATVQIILFIVGVVFLFYAFIISKNREHVLAPTIVIIAAVFIFLGLFPVRGFLQTIKLEQAACCFFAISFLVAGFQFLQREKLSLSFTVFIIAAIFAVCSFSAIQSLLRTGMLGTFTNTLIDYTKKIDDFQLTVVNMKSDLYNQQRTNEQEQVSIQQAQVAVKAQQEKINQQAGDITSLQTTLHMAQSNLDRVTLVMIEQQKLLETNQVELEIQQQTLRQAQQDVRQQEGVLTNQFEQMFQMQNQLAVAETKLNEQNEKIGGFESLVTNLYARSVIEAFDIGDKTHVTLQSLHGNTRIFFKLKYVPINASLDASMVTHPGLLRGLLGLFTGSPYNRQIQVFLGNNKNIAFGYLGVPKWDRPEFPTFATFIIRYTRMEHDTNLIQKVELKGKDVYFDGVKQVFQ